MDTQLIIQTISGLNWLEIVGAVTTILLLLITVFEFVPGEEPERTLRKIVGFLAKVSRK
jgi:hypothetical protein